MSNCAILVLFLSLAVEAAGNSSPQIPSSGDFAVARLASGASVGFALVRSGRSASASPIAEVVLPRSAGVSRVLFDQEGGAYFGYRLEVEPVQTRQYRFVFKPLSSDMDSELQRRCPTCPRPTLLPGSLPRFPGPLTVSDGDICTLDLLMNPQTGEKIVDIIKVSSEAISRETMLEAAEKIREAMAHTQRGDNLVARGNNAGAVAEYEKALAINPNDAVIQNKLGICFQRRGEVALAQKQYEQAVKLNPRYAEAWNNLGSCYHARGKLKQAIRYYQRAIDNKPAFATAYKNMGSALFGQRRFEDGYEALQAAFRLDPTVLEAGSATGIQAVDTSAATQYFYFAKLSAANGQVETAINFLQRAVDRGFKECARIAQDSDFRMVVRDPRYREVMRAVCPQP